MLKTNNIRVYNWEGSLRGMRNPLNSWHLSDTDFEMKTNPQGVQYPTIGENDYSLCKRLITAGPDHRKFLRQIFVSIDIDAPLFWWKEFDTYKVGTVANSCSTMHKIHSKEFTRADFSYETMSSETDEKSPIVYGCYKLSPSGLVDFTIHTLNYLRDKFNETKDKKYWRMMIEALPTSYNQLRTVTLNYEVLRNLYRARRHHKLTEWHTLCDVIEALPYSEFITDKWPEVSVYE